MNSHLQNSETGGDEGLSSIIAIGKYPYLTIELIQITGPLLHVRHFTSQ